MTLLATNIKGFRKRKKITQDQLALECGVSSAAVSQWESVKNPTKPELDKALKMAQMFGTTIEHLMESKNIEIGPEAGEELSVRLLTKVFVTLTQTEGLTELFEEGNLTIKANLFKALYTLYAGMAIGKSLNDAQLRIYVGLEDALPVKPKKKTKKQKK